MSAHRHFDEADLLQAALEGAASECSQCSERIAEHAAVASRMRALLTHESAIDARRNAAVAERVLSRTTRAGVARPVRAAGLWRLSTSSPAGRVAAAAILLSLASLPVVAWAAWRAPHPQPIVSTRLESPRGPSLPEPSEPQRSPRVGELAPRVASVEHEPSAGDHAAVERARELERTILGQAAVPEFEGHPDELDRIARLLVLRGRVLGDRAQASELSASAPSDEDSALEQALWCESALDRLVLAGTQEAALEPLLRLLARSQATAEQPLDLVCAVLERADRLGALDAEAAARLAELQRARPASDRVRSTAPLDAAWRAALSAALRERARSGSDAAGGAAARSSASERVIALWIAGER